MRHHSICAVSLFLGLLRCAASFPVSSMDTPSPRILSHHNEDRSMDTSPGQEPRPTETRSDSPPFAAPSPAGDKSESFVPGDQSESFVPGDNSERLVPGDKSEGLVPGDKSESLVPGDNSESLVPDDNSESLVFDTRGSRIEDSAEASNHTSPDEGGTVEGRPRAIVDVRRKHLSGEASYIIHPDNQPPPTYKPLKDLPPPTRPVAKWRPDIFMKICCSDPELDASPEEGSDNTLKGVVTSPDTREDEGQTTNQPSALPNDGDATVNQEVPMEAAAVDEDITTTATPEKGSSPSTTQRSSGSELENTLAPVNSSEVRPQGASNHTPRYEEASSSPYQDVANFLRDIASSEGFQNVFIGDLIKNFGSLDQNALKLIYSLLIGPLEDTYKEDRMGMAEDDLPSKIVAPEDTVLLTRDRLPLRDRPDDGFQPLKTSFLQSRPSEGSSFPMRPSVPVQPLPPSDEMWRPGRIYDGRQPVNRRGEERVDVITAPPTKTFEVVLGSSLSHDSKDQRNNDGGGILPRPTNQASHPLLPFDKLTLGLEMPPPEALEALPPGSILIPPSHILGQAKLPKIVPPRGSGAPTLEMPITDILPNLPFLPKPARPRPPAQPKIQDIPPRLPGFFPSRRPTMPSSLPSQPPRSPIQPPRSPIQLPRREDASLRILLRQPTGPPPIVTKMTPPHMPTLQHSFQRPHHISVPASLSPYLTPPPPPSPPSPPSLSRTPLLPLHAGAVDEKNHDHSHAFTLLDLDSFGDKEEFGTDSLPTLHVSDRNEDYHARPEVMDPEGHHLHSSHSDYYSDVLPDYLDSYYNLDYDKYYHDDSMSSAKQEPPSDDFGHEEHRPLIHEASATFHTAEQQPRIPTQVPTARTTPPALTDRGTGYSEEPLPSGTHDYPSLDDLLGVVKPNFSTPAATKQDRSQVTFLLENYRPASALPAEDKDVSVTSKQVTHHPQHSTVEDDAILPPGDFELRLEHHEGQGREGVEDDSPPVLPKGEHREHDASVSHLWKNLQLIPLTPDLFDATPRQPEDRDSLNLTSLFNTGVPLAPDAAQDLAPDLSSDDDRISVDQNGVRITLREEVLEDSEKAEAKFMAYVLIGACCGLALLSITGVIVIVRFKKTCGSRQIKTRTRLTEQDSVENISRHVSQLTAAEESGHKLGSWFTGRNEHIGSGKLRGNMALPAVHDHKREKKGGHSSSTRDLLSISSQSSPSNSPRQERRDSETIGGHAEEEEPRTSWLHNEYRTSEDELNQAAALDPRYRSQHQHQKTRGSSLASSSRHHSSDHRIHHAETVTEADSPSRSTRERRHTGQSRDSDRPSRTTNRHGARYMSSLDSEELDDRLTSRASEYPTDSELDDGTTHYDGESREPSRYFSDSRELDDVVGGRQRNQSSMTSQELGEHISRDLKQYQAHQNSHSHHQHHPEDLKHPQDSDGLAGLSSQELESEESRELRRSQSQVSFSRDNVQNEVFLEFDSMLRQHGQYLGNEPLASTLGRTSLLTNDTHLSASRANTPDSIDLPEDFCQDSGTRRRGCDHPPPSPPTTPPRFSPPPAPPRPPKPGHLSQVDAPSSQVGRGRPPSPGQFPPSPPASNQRPVYWTSEEERLI